MCHNDRLISWCVFGRLDISEFFEPDAMAMAPSFARVSSEGVFPDNLLLQPLA